MRLDGSLAALAFALVLTACGRAEGDSPGFVDPDRDPGENGVTVSLDYWRGIDLLVVVDDRRTMAAAQVKLGQELPPILEALAAAGYEYRIGVTTANDGNPWCPPLTTTPEHGLLEASSCRERLDDFVDGTLDVREQACESLCELTSLDIQPSTTDLDPTPLARPWIEGSMHASNLGPDIDLGSALACMIPQGIGGCDFSSPIDALHQNIEASQQAAQANYGFFRTWTHPAFLVLSDSIDCSLNETWAEIFAADGDKTFWADPADSSPTRAVCWNAGVACSGPSDAYTHCDPLSRDINNTPVSFADAAVLRPVGELIEQLLILGFASEPDYTPALVGLIAGYSTDGTLNYADADDPEVQHELGIGPGCIDNTGQSVPPPVRLRALVDEFPTLSPVSVCAPSYAPLLDQLQAEIEATPIDHCLPRCLWDADSSTELLDPQCRVWLQNETELAELEECERDAAGAFVVDAQGVYAIPEGESACYAMLVDPSELSPDPNDPLAEVCQLAGSNAELHLEVRPGASRASQPEVRCFETRFPEQNCPGLF